MRHLAAEPEQRVHGLGHHIGLANTRSHRIDGCLGHRLGDCGSLLHERDLVGQLDEAAWCIAASRSPSRTSGSSSSKTWTSVKPHSSRPSRHPEQPMLFDQRLDRRSDRTAH